ncbi:MULTISPECIES: DUF7239 family protein [Mycobacteroides]|uniref:Uncharacterized protein n=1 Tax=Mycobacteroides immunogenum TaxID=83262 RepID=A0A7V8LJQ9_9MYCO|nr:MULTISPECIES: hypothetical protein [Mycobacteroides]AMT71952.1 hypothetical protein ABG82_18295 [Mycobacteroides immunogenum]ANO05084.1 hypothetical protein BAB75_18580 [Mycobacteroides immunogenum]KIU40242.1 hypothetical protein TL11_13385 [Mycobacteroides immunogenum]KPG02848.1 hypothetical protein AN909_26445 [Mycobacteroides immunogenum]KPG02936.1 hypothetical protein AN908_26895 [Mycobacteroides immunogenum]
MADIDPREPKLPAWAREQLAKARNRAGDAERKLDAHLVTITKSRIWYGNYDNPIYIPEAHGYQTVYFSPSGGESSFDQIGVTIRDGAIEIQGGHSVALELQSSNFFRVCLADSRRSR